MDYETCSPESCLVTSVVTMFLGIYWHSFTSFYYYYCVCLCVYVHADAGDQCLVTSFIISHQIVFETGSLSEPRSHWSASAEIPVSFPSLRMTELPSLTTGLGLRGLCVLSSAVLGPELMSSCFLTLTKLLLTVPSHQLWSCFSCLVTALGRLDSVLSTLPASAL